MFAGPSGIPHMEAKLISYFMIVLNKGLLHNSFYHFEYPEFYCRISLIVDVTNKYGITGENKGSLFFH